VEGDGGDASGERDGSVCAHATCGEGDEGGCVDAAGAAC